MRIIRGKDAPRLLEDKKMAEKIVGSIETNLAVGDRSDSASVAAGASLVSLNRGILAVIGALADAAAAGAVTTADNLVAYIKQLVTEGIARDAVIGALDDAADSTPDTSTAMNLLRAILAACGDLEGTDILARLGALTDTAADTTDTATMIALLRQIVEAVNNGTGSPIASNLSLVDLLGAFDGGADPQGDIYQALGVDATNSVKALIDGVETKVDTAITDIGTADGKVDTAITDIASLDTVVDGIETKVDTAITDIAALDTVVDGVETKVDTAIADIGTVDGIVDAILALALPAVAYKTVEFDGQAGNGAIGTVALLTVTGAVKLKLYAICTETLVGAATLSAGTAGEPVGIIAQIADATQLAVGEIWWDGTPTTLLDDDANIPFKVIGDGADIILTIAAAAITDGTIAFRAEWQPVTQGSTLVAVA